jgi:uncharacterized membrane protein
MSDIYSTPESELQEKSDGSEYGSVENALAGDYELSLGDTLNEAWSLTKGSKTTILIAVILAAVAASIVNMVSSLIFTAVLGPIVGVLAVQLAVGLVTTPIFIGITIIGIRRACSVENKSTSIFNHFDKIVPLFLTYLLMYLLIIVGFLLLVIPGIYLSVSYSFGLALTAEKDMGPWQALETSRKAITHKWFTVFGLYLVIGIIVMLSALPLLIGLIWTIPLSVIAIGVTYRNIFGVQHDTLASE